MLKNKRLRLLCLTTVFDQSVKIVCLVSQHNPAYLSVPVQIRISQTNQPSQQYFISCSSKTLSSLIHVNHSFLFITTWHAIFLQIFVYKMTENAVKMKKGTFFKANVLDLNF